MRKVCRLTLLAVALSAFAVADGRVSAHSDFSGSEPEAGAIVDGPLTMGKMRFALPVQARPGFEILVDGGLVESFWEAFDAERTVWAGTTPDGLSGGTVTVTYAVTADDGHLIEGEIFFTVTAAEGTTVVPAETTPPRCRRRRPSPRPPWWTSPSRRCPSRLRELGIDSSTSLALSRSLGSSSCSDCRSSRSRCCDPVSPAHSHES